MSGWSGGAKRPKNTNPQQGLYYQQPWRHCLLCRANQRRRKSSLHANVFERSNQLGPFTVNLNHVTVLSSRHHADACCAAGCKGRSSSPVVCCASTRVPIARVVAMDGRFLSPVGPQREKQLARATIGNVGELLRRRLFLDDVERRTSDVGGRSLFDSMD